MQVPKLNYQFIVDAFNTKCEPHFAVNKVEYIDFEIWYLMFARAKQSKTVREESLKEMANILYNSYVIFTGQEDMNVHDLKLKSLEEFINNKTNGKNI